ncbi:MAG: hypothetical protein LC623_08765, partial [Halobacteriales archaeon]|nr:hypothetical protein [Halobacteriales archaeon]
MRPVVFLVCPFNIDPPFTGGATRINGIRQALAQEFHVIVLAPAYTTIRQAATGAADPDYHTFGSGRRRDQFYCRDLVRGA